MTHARKVRTVAEVRPRRLPLVAAAAVTGLVALILLALRRDIAVATGPMIWWGLSALSLATLAAIAAALVRPRPLMRAEPGGLSFPSLLRAPIRWPSIRRIETSTARHAGGDTRDRLVIHFKSPQPMAWRDRALERRLGDTPQAALAVPVGLGWPVRAETVRDLIRDAARDFAATADAASAVPAARRKRWPWACAALALAAFLPAAWQGLDGGLPRLFSTGLALYYDGRVEDAVPYLAADARAGDVEAQYVLGTIHLNGDGVERNPSMALAWFRRAAEAGHADAAFRVGDGYRLGLGTAADVGTAIRWYERAADGGSADAAYALSRMYRLGDGVRRDYATALGWLTLAAERGLAAAEHDLGRLYHDGLGVERDTRAAEIWYRRALARGHAAAGFDLARLKLDGGPADLDQGLDLLTDAADAGFPAAQRRLALMLHRGDRLAADPVAAYKWISLAEREWPAETRADLVRERARIEATLSAQARADGKALIRAWRPARPSGSR